MSTVYYKVTILCYSVIYYQKGKNKKESYYFIFMVLLDYKKKVGKENHETARVM